jgi:hypothetical protein
LKDTILQLAEIGSWRWSKRAKERDDPILSYRKCSQSISLRKILKKDMDSIKYFLIHVNLNSKRSNKILPKEGEHNVVVSCATLLMISDLKHEKLRITIFREW